MPVSVAPASVTTLPVPTFAVSKVAVPPVRVTTSAPRTPTSVRVCTTAVVVASYTLFATVKLPVSPRAVIFAVVVLTEARL